MDYYAQCIMDESAKLGTGQDADVLYIQNMTAILAGTLVFYGIKTSYSKKVYNAVWGSSGLDPRLSLGYYAYKITGDRTYNGTYAYSIALDKVVKLKV